MCYRDVRWDYQKAKIWHSGTGNWTCVVNEEKKTASRCLRVCQAVSARRYEIVGLKTTNHAIVLTEKKTLAFLYRVIKFFSHRLTSVCVLTQKVHLICLIIFLMWHNHRDFRVLIFVTKSRCESLTLVVVCLFPVCVCREKLPSFRQTFQILFLCSLNVMIDSQSVWFFPLTPLFKIVCYLKQCGKAAARVRHWVLLNGQCWYSMVVVVDILCTSGLFIIKNDFVF